MLPHTTHTQGNDTPKGSHRKSNLEPFITLTTTSHTNTYTHLQNRLKAIYTHKIMSYTEGSGEGKRQGQDSAGSGNTRSINYTQTCQERKITK